jgi:hypothetical protein
MEQKLTLRVGEDGLNRWLAARRPVEMVRHPKLEDSRHTKSGTTHSNDVNCDRRRPSGDSL